jgi:membrane protease YdiL (CAAX protease family)
VLLGLAMLWPTGLTWLYFIALDGAPAPWPQAAYTVGKLIQFSLPLAGWWLARRSLFPLPCPVWVDILWGLAGGLAVAGAMAGLYELWMKPAGLLAAASGAIAHKAASLGLKTPAALAAAGVFYAVIHSLLEEYYWRWFVFGQLRRVLSLVAAAGLSGMAFGAHHFLLLGAFFGAAAPATWLLGAAVIAGGAIWALVYEARGNLYACWLSHALIDAAIFAVGYDLVRQQPLAG